jgi:NADH-quinone oxidoreductase subunit L
MIMETVLGLIPALPLAGFLALGIFGRKMSKSAVAWTGVGSIGVSAALALAAAGRFLAAPPGFSVTASYWTWFKVEGFQPVLALRFDALSMVFVLVVTFVGFMIHLYSAEYMVREEGYSRFFAYLNLFVGSMLILVLANNLIFLYLGWEGVGLCSYLLIGFWYKEPKNGRAAQKAFIVTRVGDTAFAIGLFLLFFRLGTLNIQELMTRAADQWPVGSSLAVAAAALLLGGAIGKSAQLPLQTWLPDAMAGPTPVSALIHAATMVTAGVYLIARTHVLYTLAPVVALAVAVIGAVTLLVSGFSALAQIDIKRVLAYSTISQIGYMFLALGSGVWAAGIFHFMTHAFFKALLFLGAGVIIQGLGEEHSIFRMGGIRRQLPVVFWTFLVGAASLSALPIVTAGFYSKEWILWSAWSGPHGSPWLWGAGLLGAFLTVLYTFRMVFTALFGPPQKKVDRFPGLPIKIPLVVLAGLAVAAGVLQVPRSLGNLPVLRNFLRLVLPAPAAGTRTGPETLLEIASIVVVLFGLFLAYLMYLRFRARTGALSKTPAGEKASAFLFSGFGFDWIYDRMFVRPLGWLARVNKGDVIDLPYRGLAALSRAGNSILSRTQTGQLRWYAAAVAAGTIIALAVAVFL